MKSYAKAFFVATCFSVCTFTYAGNEQSTSVAKEVVSKFFEYLRAGDISSMDPLFFRIPAMESSKADWLMLIKSVSEKVENEQLDWEVICGKELPEMAAVIVNQTMKQGKKHADPDAIYLVNKDGRWLLLPDQIAENAKDAVRSSLSSVQLSELFALERWALGEIRGITEDCR